MLEAIERAQAELRVRNVPEVFVEMAGMAENMWEAATVYDAATHDAAVKPSKASTALPYVTGAIAFYLAIGTCGFLSSAFAAAAVYYAAATVFAALSAMDVFSGSLAGHRSTAAAVRLIYDKIPFASAQALMEGMRKRRMMVLKAPLATAAMSITMFIASYVTAGKFSLESLVAYWQPALTSDPIALLCAAAIEAAAAFAIGYVVAAAAGLAIMWNDMTDDGQRAEIRKWEAAERAQEREIRDLMAIRRRAEQSHLPRNLIPEDVDGYHVISMSVQPYILDDNDNRVAIDPIVKVSRYYSAHDLLDNDGTVSDAFDPRRTRLEEYALSGLPDGELLAAFVHASRDISVSVSLGTFTGFQDYELEASRAVAAEVKRRGLA